jgi:putative tryptophan/tyrosine transport system substrate-binding protein
VPAIYNFQEFVMKRRAFITLLGGAAAWPVVGHAQHKMWRIAFITHVPIPDYDELFESLRALGYVGGQNIVVERRYAQGKAEKFQDFAAEMVRLKVDLIITNTTPAALAAKNVTTAIPIVIPTAIDPVGTGLIANLARPAGNITGGAILTGELAAKRLELLKEVVSSLSRTAVLWNSANPANALAWRETQSAARALGVTLQSHEVQSPKDFEVAFARMAKERPDALSVLDDAMTIQYRKEIAEFAIQSRLPSMFAAKDRVKAGGLMSYGPNYSEIMRHGASLVDKILRGAEPANLPMEQPTKFDLVINLKSARAIGLETPPTILLRADEVIE